MKRNPMHMPRLPLAAASAAAILCSLAWTGAALAGSETGAASRTGSGGAIPSAQTGTSSGAQTGTSSGAQAGMAGEGAHAGQAPGEGVAKRLPDNYKISNWIGKPVENRQGDKLGKVEDLVMDDIGVVRYVIMESDMQGEGQEDNVVAVPIGHFQYPLTQDPLLTLDVSPQQMSGAPSFDRTQTPNMGQESLSTVIIAYWLPEDAQMQGQGQQDEAGAASTPGEQGEQQAGAGGTAGQSGSQGGQAAMQQRFDANRDMVYLEPEKAKLFNKLDQDSSGSIERSEASANEDVADKFDQLDSYSNNRVTRSEFAAFELQEDGGSKSEQQPQRPSGSGSPGGM
jgi:hypothetical protein